VYTPRFFLVLEQIKGNLIIFISKIKYSLSKNKLARSLTETQLSLVTT